MGALPLLGVAIGILGGLLMSNAARDQDRRNSPWPYVVGMIGIGACAAATVIWG